MQKILMFNVDCGDGSSLTRFLIDGPDVAARLMALMDDEPETYAASEGYTTLTFPDDLDLSTTGIRAVTAAEFFDDYDDDEEEECNGNCDSCSCAPPIMI